MANRSLTEILASADAGLTVPVKLNVSTGKDNDEAGTKKVSTEVETRLPKDLHAAVKIFGEKIVLRYFANALVVDIQGEERNKLKPQTGEGKGRKRASYLESLGI